MPSSYEKDLGIFITFGPKGEFGNILTQFFTYSFASTFCVTFLQFPKY
ncbi:hypothetical protein B4158_3674 [Bacillus cereus]|nr:hypothetical protein B4158_3674 [Bacillus cereus]